MATTTKTHVMKITGVPEELLQLVDNRVSERHYAGRSEYVRELIRRDMTEGTHSTKLTDLKPHTEAELSAIFARIESRDWGHVQPLAPGADSREAIYGDHG